MTIAPAGKAEVWYRDLSSTQQPVEWVPAACPDSGLTITHRFLRTTILGIDLPERCDVKIAFPFTGKDGVCGTETRLLLEVHNGECLYPDQSISRCMTPSTPTPKPEVKVVSAVLFDRQGKIYIQKRSADSSRPNMWEFPGGKVEPGERLHEALVREVMEETSFEMRRVQEIMPVCFQEFEYPESWMTQFVFGYLVDDVESACAREWPRNGTWVQGSVMHGIDMLPSNRIILPTVKSFVNRCLAMAQRT